MADTRSDDIRDEIRRQIISGRLPAGSRLPTERDLAARYGTSLTTLNKVMAGLELEGLLERRRGTGTFVRPDLAERAMGVVLGPPDAPPGPKFWATLARAALESAAKGPGGVRGYLAAGSVPPEETALARDAAAGRLAGALLLGAGAGPAEALARVGLASVRLAGDGPGPSVGPAWREAVRETAARMLSRGAWPLAIALPPGPWADDMADGYADALTLRGLAPDPGLVGRADQADGPPGWAWARGLVGRGVRGLLLLGAGPEAALAAVAAARVRVPEDLALVVAAIAGQTPAFSVGLARLELDPMALVQAGLALLADVRRADADGGDRPLPSRRLEPRFIAGATLHMNI